MTHIQKFQSEAPAPRCRFCGSGLFKTFADLGMSPLCQTHIEPDQLNHMERFYPLHAWVCSECYLVQLEEYVSPDSIFSDYAYFSSYSDSWVEHARTYCEEMRRRFELSAASCVMEIASNDGYLLQHFVRAGIPCLGIEPAENVARVAVENGIPTEVCFFGRESAATVAGKYGKADLLLGNNVLAHVPNINDFVSGMKHLLARDGVITMEFPHLQRLMEQNQYDTIYHEHFSYLSLHTVRRVFGHHGLELFDVEELSTHGGSLRIFACHGGERSGEITERLGRVLDGEQAAGLLRLETYGLFEEKVKESKRALLEFLIGAKRAGKKIVGYGAPGKGNTLLNYCGIRSDFLDFTVDRSPHKQGRYTPGTHIPILDPSALREARPDYVLILPWNLKEEIMAQHAYVADWGGRFVVPIPSVKVC